MRYVIDAHRWPIDAALLAKVQALPALQQLARFEDCMLRLPLTEQRAALLAAGAPLTSDTLGTSTPRRGALPVS